MIEVVCDPGSRYTKIVAARRGSPEVVAQVLPSRDALDLRKAMRRTARALRPGLVERTQLWLLGEGRKVRTLSLGPALARAAKELGAPMLLADCGGLRTRVFEVDRTGALTRTLENERCAAGGGRFVETMSAALQVELTQLDARLHGVAAPYRVSSPCLVFAESEAVSQVNQGVPGPAVLLGVLHHAVEKVASLIERGKPAGRPVLIIGGLARLTSFRARLAEALPTTALHSPPGDPQLFGAMAGMAQVLALSQAPWPEPKLLAADAS